MKVALAARRPEIWRRSRQETAREDLCLQCDRARAVAKLFADVEARPRGARRRRLQCELSHARSAYRSCSRRSRESIEVSAFAGFLVAQEAAKRMLPQASRRDHFHRRLREREGLCAVGAVCHGQIRAARPGAEHGAGTVAAGHPRWPCRDRRRHPQRAPARSAGQARQHARSRRHCAELSRSFAAAAQRVGLGDRIAALGGAILNPPSGGTAQRRLRGSRRRFTLSLVSAISPLSVRSIWASARPTTAPSITR